MKMNKFAVFTLLFGSLMINSGFTDDDTEKSEEKTESAEVKVEENGNDVKSEEENKDGVDKQEEEKNSSDKPESSEENFEEAKQPAKKAHVKHHNKKNNKLREAAAKATLELNKTMPSAVQPTDSTQSPVDENSNQEVKVLEQKEDGKYQEQQPQTSEEEKVETTENSAK